MSTTFSTTTVTDTSTDTSSASAPVARTSRRRALWTAGLVSGVAAAAATTVIAVAARAVDIPLEVDGEQIPLFGFAQLTMIGAVIGTVLALAMSKWAAKPRRTFVVTTVTLTALSLVPDVTVDASTGSKLVLMLTHVVAAAIVVPVPRQAPRRLTSTPLPGDRPSMGRSLRVVSRSFGSSAFRVSHRYGHIGQEVIGMTTDLLDLYRSASHWTLNKVAGATDQLDAETPCDGWDVRQLLNHMLETQQYFVRSARGEDASPPSPTPPRSSATIRWPTSDAPSPTRSAPSARTA